MPGWLKASLGLVQSLFQCFLKLVYVFSKLRSAISSWLSAYLKSVEGLIKVHVGIQGVHIKVGRWIDRLDWLDRLGR